MVSNKCYKNACKEKNLVYGMTETDSVQVGLELNAFTSVSAPFYFKSDFRYYTREDTVNTGPPGRPTLFTLCVVMTYAVARYACMCSHTHTPASVHIYILIYLFIHVFIYSFIYEHAHVHAYRAEPVLVLKQASTSDRPLCWPGDPWAHRRHPTRPCESRHQADLSV